MKRIGFFPIALALVLGGCPRPECHLVDECLDQTCSDLEGADWFKCSTAALREGGVCARTSQMQIQLCPAGLNEQTRQSEMAGSTPPNGGNQSLMEFVAAEAGLTEGTTEQLVKAERYCERNDCSELSPAQLADRNKLSDDARIEVNGALVAHGQAPLLTEAATTSESAPATRAPH